MLNINYKDYDFTVAVNGYEDDGRLANAFAGKDGEVPVVELDSFNYEYLEGYLQDQVSIYDNDEIIEVLENVIKEYDDNQKSENPVENILDNILVKKKEFEIGEHFGIWNFQVVEIKKI
jgi:predicted Ser/Thr protein kinase